MLNSVEQLFSVPIIVGTVQADNEALRELILSHRDNKVLVDHSDPNYEDTYLPLYNLATNTVIMQVLEDLSNMGEPDLNCTELWSHIHEKNMSTNWHNHGCVYAGVYYVSLPEGSGDLIFERDENQERVKVTPKVGEYIIFPAWLKHAVTRNQSDDLRISMSFNLERI